ncbi:MAG: SurA N-terminal domain-containing protein [Bacillota bacterium]
MLTRTLVLLMVFIMLIVASGCGKKEVVATVNGESITRDQLDEMVADMKKYYKSQGLDLDLNKDSGMTDMINSMTMEQLITQTLLLQEAKKMGIQVSKEEVDKEIAKYKETMTEEKFKNFLEDNKLTEARLNQLIERDLIIQGLQKKLLEDVKPATEAQAREYYDKNKKEFVVPVSYQVRHILASSVGGEQEKDKLDLEAKTKIQAVLEQLKQGKDFAALAKEKSEDPGTASQGGSFTFSPGEAVEEFELASKALKPGEYTTEPVKTTYGYHVIKMEKITPEKQKSFEEVKEEIIETLSGDAKQEKVDKFIEDVKNKAEIVNKLEKAEDKKSQNEEGKNTENQK